MKIQFVTYHYRYLLLFILLLLAGLTAFSGTAFDQANKKYREQRFAEAVKLYHESVRLEGPNSVVYYNLGNAYYRLKKYPEAVLYFEKSLKLGPSGEQAAFNLQLARDKALTKIESSGGFFVVRYARDLIHTYGARSWSVLFLLLVWTGVALMLRWFRITPGQGFRYRFAGALSLVLAIGCFFIARHRYMEQTAYSHAVVLRPDAELKAEPVQGAATKTRIEAGNKVELLDRDAAWYKVELPNGKTGWVSAKDLVLI